MPMIQQLDLVRSATVGKVVAVVAAKIVVATAIGQIQRVQVFGQDREHGFGIVGSQRGGNRRCAVVQVGTTTGATIATTVVVVVVQVVVICRHATHAATARRRTGRVVIGAVVAWMKMKIVGATHGRHTRSSDGAVANGQRIHHGAAICLLLLLLLLQDHVVVLLLGSQTGRQGANGKPETTAT